MDDQSQIQQRLAQAGIPERHAAIVLAYLAGRGQVQLAKQFGMAQSTVSGVIRRSLATVGISIDDVKRKAQAVRAASVKGRSEKLKYLSREQEIDLIARFKAGDSEAATALYVAHRWLILMYVTQYNRDLYIDKDDMIAELTAVFYQAAFDFDPGLGVLFRSYADKLIKYRAMNLRIWKRRELGDCSLDESVFKDDEEMTLGSTVAAVQDDDDAYDDDRRAAEDDVAAAVRDAVETLPDDLRAYVKAAYFDGQTKAEAARTTLGIRADVGDSRVGSRLKKVLAGVAPLYHAGYRRLPA